MSDDHGFESLGTAALMRLHRASLFELYRRGVVRTLNAPQGDWAELLVVTAYGGFLAPNSVKSYDVLAADGRRLQVKSRAIDHERVGSDITSPFRSFDFDAAVIVLLDPIHLGVGRAAELSVDLVRQHASYRKHVNGYVLLPTPGLMDLGVDKTMDLRSAAEQL
jgi:hypothetical protein